MNFGSEILADSTQTNKRGLSVRSHLLITTIETERPSILMKHIEVHLRSIKTEPGGKESQSKDDDLHHKRSVQATVDHFEID